MLPRLADGFFEPPPRRRGRGWWRRFPRAFAWGALAAGVGGAFTAASVSTWLDRVDAMRIIRAGHQSAVRVVGKRSTSGKAPSYYVQYSRTGPVGVDLFERPVARRDWMHAQRDMWDVYYHDPATGRGITGMERAYRERWDGAALCAVMALVCLGLGGDGLRRAAREMRLFRSGVELYTSEGGRSFNPPDGSDPVPVTVTGSRDALVRIGPAGGELLVLTSDNGRNWILPRLRDVPVERLTFDEPLSRLLVPPGRALTPQWRAWVGRRHRAWPIAMLVVGGVTGVLAPFLHGLNANAFAVVVSAGLLLTTIVGLAWVRRRLRDFVLWREGEEVHALLVEERWEQRRCVYAVAFRHRDTERRAVIRVPASHPLMRIASPPEAPAMTTRVVLLVDPLRPERWTPVPESCV